jgi:RecA-family ATPase
LAAIGSAPCHLGKTLYLSAEDDATELNFRMFDICQHYGAEFTNLSDFRLVDLVGEDAVLGQVQRNGTIQATNLLKAVEMEIADFRPDLVIIDALADLFAGDENNRMQARQFIGLLKRPAKEYGCAFLCMAHPSLSGMNTGRGTSGSTAWSNSVRSRLYFEAAKASDNSEPDTDLRLLSVRKANYGPKDHQITLRWKAGVFVPEAGTGSLDKLAVEAKADQVFLDLLRAMIEQKQSVSARPGPTYAPTQFAKRPNANGIGKDAFAKAMQRLLDRKDIWVEETGPQSRRRSRLFCA